MKILYDEIIDDDIYLYGKYLCNLSVYNVRKYYTASFRFQSPLQSN